MTNMFDVNLLLNMTTYLHQELEYLPWKTALYIAEELHMVMKFQPSYGAYQVCILHLFRVMKTIYDLFVLWDVLSCVLFQLIKIRKTVIEI